MVLAWAGDLPCGAGMTVVIAVVGQQYAIGDGAGSLEVCDRLPLTCVSNYQVANAISLLQTLKRYERRGEIAALIERPTIRATCEGVEAFVAGTFCGSLIAALSTVAAHVHLPFPQTWRGKLAVPCDYLGTINAAQHKFGVDRFRTDMTEPRMFACEAEKSAACLLTLFAKANKTRTARSAAA